MKDVRSTVYLDAAGAPLSGREPAYLDRMWAPGDSFMRFGADIRVLAVEVRDRTQFVTTDIVRRLRVRT